MFDKIKGLNSVLRESLDGLYTRQQTITNNLANVDTPGFKGQEVLFEEQLKAHINPKKYDRGFDINYTHSNHIPLEQELNLDPVVIQIKNSQVKMDGNNVDLDHEMTKMTQAQITYNAVSQMISGRFSGMRQVITEGGG